MFSTGIYAFAEARSLMHLKYKAELFLEKNFLQVCQEDEFRELELQGVTTILNSERLHIEHESQVFKFSCASYFKTLKTMLKG